MFLCASIHSIHISSCYVTGGAGIQDIRWPSGNDGLQFTMFGSHGLLQVWESKKTERLLRFTDRCSVRLSVSHVVGFSVIYVCT